MTRKEKSFQEVIQVVESYHKMYKLKGGQAYHLETNDFELGVGGEGQDTSRHFEGGFGSMHAILPFLFVEGYVLIGHVG